MPSAARRQDGVRAPLADYTILDAMEEPELFGPFFTGPQWRGWKAFLGALFGLPLGPTLRPIVEKHTQRTEMTTAQVKEGWLVVGRRGGKSRIAALLATYFACLRDYHPYLAPGELALIPVLASDKEQAQAIFGYTCGFLENIPALRPLLAKKPTGQHVLLRTGVEIKVRAATFRGIRGRPIPLALCDEIAFWRNEESRNPDVEILRAIRPGMLTIPDAMLIALSSPYARRGELWEHYKQHFGKPNPRIVVWQAETLDMNPLADREEIAAAYREDAVAAAAEYGGQFRSDLEAYVPQEIVDAAMAGQPAERAPSAGTNYQAFADPSGGRADSFTLAIAHAAADRAVLDRVLEVVPPFSPEEVVATFASVLKEYGCTTVDGDHYAGEWPRERFAKHGITYRVTAWNKSELYLGFLPGLVSGRVDLVALPRLANQLCALDRRTSRLGKDSVDHPPGGHDDVANAVAGVLAPLVGGLSDTLGFARYLAEGGLSVEALQVAAATPAAAEPVAPSQWAGRPVPPRPVARERKLAGLAALDAREMGRR